MSLAVANMPDDPAKLPRWLDEQLVGGRLGELVAELAGARSGANEDRSLADVLGEALPAVLERGLAAAAPQTVRMLLRRPRLLLELQERVFLDGGEYWRGLPRVAGLVERAEATWARLEAASRRRVSPAAPARSREWLRWSVSLVTAAALLLAVFGGWQLLQRSDSDATAWGWARGLPDESDATRYLNRLAEQAEEWDDKRPTTVPALVRRLGEFRQGCGVLLTAGHALLNEAQRRDLWESCRKWSVTIDELIVRAQLGEDIAAVRGEADALVARLAAVLRGRIAEHRA